MPSDVTIQNSVFTGNEGTVGGAVSLWSDNLNAEELAASSGSGDITYTFDNVKFIGNKADREGADLGKGGAVAFMPFENLHNATVNADLSNVTFTENSSNGTGGAIQVESTNLILNGSTFTGNTAGTKGGAIYIDELSSTELSGDNLLENNIAAGDANDVHNKGELTVADGTTLMNSGYTQEGADSALIVKSGATLGIAMPDLGGVTAENGEAMLALGQKLDLSEGGSLTVGSVDEANDAQVAFGSDSMLVVDGNIATGADDAVITGNGGEIFVDKGSKLYIANASGRHRLHHCQPAVA